MPANTGISVDELIEELETYEESLHTAEWKMNVEPVDGITEGYDATIQFVQTVIDKLEDSTNKDPTMTKLLSTLYNIHAVLEDIHDKCVTM